ncbi:hypothetical protein ACFL4D_02860 [Candidatus Margulisiibacteriota bacterium]
MSSSRSTSSTKTTGNPAIKSDNHSLRVNKAPEYQSRIRCKYCKGLYITKRGLRYKKYETVQLYYCKSCRKTFTDSKRKHKTYPLEIIFEGLGSYYRGQNYAQATRDLNSTYDIDIDPKSLRDWIKKTKSYCLYAPYRKKAMSRFPAPEAVREVPLRSDNRSVFCFHQAKLKLLLERYRFLPFSRLNKWLDHLHTLLKDNRYPHGFYNIHQHVILPDNLRLKQQSVNMAIFLARLIEEEVSRKTRRKELLPKLMLAIDSATIATNVPVLLIPSNINHLAKHLPPETLPELPLSPVIIGAIDLIQVRSGKIHLLHYKAYPTKQDPTTQLNLHAQLISQASGLPLNKFKCAWFNAGGYWEFWPT